MSPRFLTVARAAQLVSCSVRRLRRAIRDGELAPIDVGGPLLLDLEEVAAWLRAHRVDPSERGRARAAERIAAEEAKR